MSQMTRRYKQIFSDYYSCCLKFCLCTTPLALYYIILDVILNFKISLIVYIYINVMFLVNITSKEKVGPSIALGGGGEVDGLSRSLNLQSFASKK